MSVLRELPSRRTWRWWRATAPAVLGAALLAACGGGTSQVENYAPTRVVVLGEDSSVLDDTANPGNARKYSVNGVDSSNAVDCNQLPLVAQRVAARYAMNFKECLAAGSTATVNAFDYAVPGATVEDGSIGLAAQIARAGTLGDKDLLSVWIGTNDIIDIYTRRVAGEYTSDAQALAEAARRGAAAAGIINEKILAVGAHAIVITAPDMGLSPYARARLTASTPDPSAMTRLSEISNSFNGYLRVSIDPQRFDGRNFGLVFADEAVQAINANSAGYTTYLVSPYNITDAACGSAPLLACSNAIDTTTNLNTGGLVTGALYNTHLWASDRWLGYPAHYLLGLTAQNRLSVLPF